MAPRALGALLALVAVVAFAVSIATSAWWTGHPVVAGRPITAKDVHVGLLGAEGCNTGGDGRCEPVEVKTTYKVAMYAEIGIVGLTAILALALAISVWTVGDRRKGLARATLTFTIIAAAGGGIVLALGPAIKAGQHVDVPIGWGLYVFGGAIAASMLGAAIGRKVEQEPLRLKPSNAPMMSSQQRDVRDMLREQDGMLHPGSRKSEPRFGHEQPRTSVPLFGAAPQLRPLYDPQNEGLIPAPPPPALPARAPTPLPQRAISALTGMPTPPPPNLNADAFAQTPDPFGQTDFQQHAARAESEPIEPPPPQQQSGPPRAYARGPATTPPSTTSPPRMASPTSPPRTSPPTNPPRMSPPTTPPRTSPPAGSSAGPRTSPTTNPPPGSRTSPPTNPPAGPRTNPPTNPPPGSRTSPPTNAPVGPRTNPQTNPPSRPKLPTMPPIGARTSPPSTPPSNAPAGPKTTTMPPPAGPKTQTSGAVPAPSIESVQSRSGKKVTVPPPARNTPDPRKSQSTLPNAIPPMPTAENLSPSERSATDMDADRDVGDRTDASVEAAPPSTDAPNIDPVAAPPMRPSEMTDPEAARASMRPSELNDRDAAQAPSRPSDMTDPSADPSPADSTDQTKPPEDMIERDPKAPTPLAPAPVAQASAAAPLATAAAAPEKPVQIPISTASPSLPPPKQTTGTTSGPTPACPQCEAPMAWVDEHLRFYCKSCRMYF